MLVLLPLSTPAAGERPGKNARQIEGSRLELPPKILKAVSLSSQDVRPVPDKKKAAAAAFFPWLRVCYWKRQSAATLSTSTFGPPLLPKLS